MLKNLLKQFWHYELFWKWWGRAIWLSFGMCWFLLIWGSYLETIK